MYLKTQTLLTLLFLPHRVGDLSECRCQSDVGGDKSTKVSSDCKVIEPEVEIFLNRSKTKHTNAHAFKHSLIRQVPTAAGCSPKWHIWEGDRKQVSPRRLSPCLSETAGMNSSSRWAFSEMCKCEAWDWEAKRKGDGQRTSTECLLQTGPESPKNCAAFVASNLEQSRFGACVERPRKGRCVAQTVTPTE